MIKTNFTCRSCSGHRSATILEMGELPLANAFAESETDTVDHFRAHQTLVMCEDCRLIQLREIVPREELFRDYLWVTGTSRAAANHAAWLAKRLAQRDLNGGNNFLVEIASNDGFFLKEYQKVGFKVLGVDPSNIAGDAQRQGIPTIQDFFGVAVAERIASESGRANVVVARNVIGHACELRDLIQGAALLLERGGRLIIEHPYAYLMREQVQYDQVFHEHVSYPTVRSVANLLAQFNLKLVDVSFVDMNGGSMLVEATQESDQTPRSGQELIEFEDFIKLNEPGGWKEFRDTVETQRHQLLQLLNGLRAEGKRVVGYGAAAKSMVMLNFCGIDPTLVTAFGDANPRKQRLLCPGVRIPVVSPDEMLDMKPDFILIGAWNLKEEITRALRAKGFTGKFIVPLPRPTLV